MATNDTILVVDDEPKLARSLALILQRAGYGVTTAASAGEALQLLQAGAYDLVFLDIKLPDQSGVQLLPQIRSLYPDMPVLMLTAHASLETAIEAVRAGARDYLLKPIDPEAILARVKKILDEQKQPKRRREITTQIQALLSRIAYHRCQRGLCVWFCHGHASGGSGAVFETRATRARPAHPPRILE